MLTSHLEFRKPLDGFKRSQNSQHSERLDCLDVSAFVVSVDSEVQHSGAKLWTQSHAHGHMAHTQSKTVKNKNIFKEKGAYQKNNETHNLDCVCTETSRWQGVTF